jgi:hypothetical protein
LGIFCCFKFLLIAPDGVTCEQSRHVEAQPGHVEASMGRPLMEALLPAAGS